MTTIGRKSAMRSAATQTPDPVVVVDLERERDRGEIRAEARPGRRQEEVPERRRPAKEAETAGALHVRR